MEGKFYKDVQESGRRYSTISAYSGADDTDPDEPLRLKDRRPKQRMFDIESHAEVLNVIPDQTVPQPYRPSRKSKAKKPTPDETDEFAHWHTVPLKQQTKSIFDPEIESETEELPPISPSPVRENNPSAKWQKEGSELAKIQAQHEADRKKRREERRARKKAEAQQEEERIKRLEARNARKQAEAKLREEVARTVSADRHMKRSQSRSRNREVVPLDIEQMRPQTSQKPCCNWFGCAPVFACFGNMFRWCGSGCCCNRNDNR
ncbi:hypothetical protein EDC01DRAFT_634142 [Geopyxis carbonaria]|nr:hypothetical protein EDC01DRAFT_634142 [Geopyxis carbonaria]